MTKEKRIARITTWQIVIFLIPVVLHILRLFRQRPHFGGIPWSSTIDIVRTLSTFLAIGCVMLLEIYKRRRSGKS